MHIFKNKNQDGQHDENQNVLVVQEHRMSQCQPKTYQTIAPSRREFDPIKYQV